ncbi:1-aminocyclopropane-1-carboxylate deaminase/D-cysteine desulfhydrase [Halioxenophilus sp. WMMB6]|uniref:1-aminocyclopropane-1-carboxylate deaminase/D-cysteine desulfhydrase n=1 Tax=Halioxenophilus sp. WMMB6 TaxID=3073815 RepID=UPI00295F5A4A|nr:pyridoxal-phosphate dependent enzyme [Halioxenophilus sp. WMMB6]
MPSPKDAFYLPDPTPLEKIDWSLAKQWGVNCWIKRDDLIHPSCSGNKWYKLINNLSAMKNAGLQRLLSFGGGYSNHLHALALVGKLFDIETIGVVRGDYHTHLTPTLVDCLSAGMRIHYVTKSEWSLRDSVDFQSALHARYGPAWVIPEGGNNSEGFSGCRLIASSILEQLPQNLNRTVNLFVACGTGTTMAGLVAELPAQFNVHGISVVKGADTITQTISEYLSKANIQPRCRWHVHHEWHCGGYAKFPNYLANFVNRFESETSILLDPVYTAKVLFAIAQWMENGSLVMGDHVVMLHTGGLQGRRGVTSLQ